MQLTTDTRRAAGRLRDERGVTLIELLVVIAILGIIAVPLGNALITFFLHSDDTNRRLSVSHDAQIAAAYFAQDVASVGVHDWSAPGFPLIPSVEVNVGPTEGLSWCGPAGTPTAVVRMAWDNPTAAVGPSEVVRVSYVVETVGGEKQLHRLKCGGTAHNPTLLSDLVLSHNVDSVGPVTCNPNPTCTPAGTPQTVTLVLNLRVSGSNDPIFTVTLTGQRRQS
jgi:prepilin-type N-terminal cleavage/methylation domain-containing protein